MRTTGEILRERREALGMTPREAAARAGLDMNQILACEADASTWQTARTYASGALGKRLVAFGVRSRKLSTNSVALASDVKWETAREVLAIVADERNAASNPQLSKVHAVLAVLHQGRVVLH